MKPKNVPQLTREELLSTYPSVRTLDLSLVNVVMIPGYYSKLGSKPGNDIGIYDDAAVVISPSCYATFNANTDPSLERTGIATLKPGTYPYRLGNHGQSKPGGGYPAFRPDTPGERLPVWRHGSKDQNLYGVALNIHSGGYHGTSSEGCQTIYPDQWDHFYALVKGEMRRLRQKRFNFHKVNV